MVQNRHQRGLGFGTVCQPMLTAMQHCTQLYTGGLSQPSGTSDPRVSACCRRSVCGHCLDFAEMPQPLIKARCGALVLALQKLRSPFVFSSRSSWRCGSLPCASSSSQHAIGGTISIYCWSCLGRAEGSAPGGSLGFRSGVARHQREVGIGGCSDIRCPDLDESRHDLGVVLVSRWYCIATVPAVC